MSHVVTIRTEIRDAAAIRSACQRLQLPEPVFGEAKLFTSTETGLAVRLNGWRYPVVCDLASGSLKYDNFNGRWGEQHELEKFQQMYAVEKAALEACRKGHSVTEQALADGSIKLTIQVAGGAA